MIFIMNLKIIVKIMKKKKEIMGIITLQMFVLLDIWVKKSMKNLMIDKKEKNIKSNY